MAADRELPLLERVRFLSIFGSNLDEFFQVRVALLRAEFEAGLVASSPDGRTPAEQLAEVRARILQLQEVEEQIGKELLGELADAGIRVVGWDDLDKRDRKQLGQIFEEKIFPVLTPLSVDPAHPFPYISNLSFNLAVLVRHPGTKAVRFARIKVPPVLGRFLPLSDGERFIPIEQVLAARLERLFSGMEVESHFFFRVTRDADMDLDDETDDLMRAIESGLHRRHRLSDAVRLEIDESMSSEARNLLVEELELREEDVYVRRGMLDLSDLGQFYNLERPELKLEPWTPRTQAQLGAGDGEESDLFNVLRQGDVLVQHPYDSFESSVGAFLTQAADDPQVVAIKHTLYRSGTENPIARTVIRAANAGKQVVTLVELQARFDEQTNIEWARKLEEAGVHVVYGLLGLKTHGKIVLVVRQEEGQLRRYCHVGTGNYNVATSRHYEDIGLFSASPELGADLSDLFNHLTGYSRHPEYRKLLVAPDTLRSGLLDQIRQEMEAPDGRILVKCNGLVDARLIDALYEASQAGVEIDLIVRGVCCLRPGVPGLSDRIRVRSILGRFLEHSRIFRFGSEARGPRYFIGSADWMPRNLDRRVEVVAPIEDPALQGRLEEILQLLLADDAQAWQLDAEGSWNPPIRKRGLRAQEELQKLARQRAQRGSSVLD